jgi:alpha-glucuronidase
MHCPKAITLFFLAIFPVLLLCAEDGHQLWLRPKKALPVTVISASSSATLNIAVKELEQGWQGKSGATVTLSIKKNKGMGADGFKLTENSIEANTSIGILYGVYELLRRQQTNEGITNDISNPSYNIRVLNHWDNPDGTIERGYAGNSIFWRRENSFVVTDADKLRWQEYARADASVGINGAVLNNVNSSPLILSADYLTRSKLIADVLRHYGVKVYLSVKFSSPSLAGKLKTSNPFDPEVISWWKERIKEIYTLIPDFGGFLIKASSEGQPGPQDYGRTHADGANLLADLLKPHNGIVMWRAFVYSPYDKDRAKQAYNEFVPLDGQFRDNVIIQVKNGPVDFQPREPFSPLFGALKKTAVMPEFQITQEYLGHSAYLVFLATMWEECLQSDTYQYGAGSTVARCTDGTLQQKKYSAIAGVANIGLDTNWCGHEFAQANWYAFGRLAWNNKIRSEQIAREWIKLTFYGAMNSNDAVYNLAQWDSAFLKPVIAMMLESREAAVNYMTPMGLHHIMSANEHYGPGPWWAPPKMRPDWTPPYYHRADSSGIGFDRTRDGSDAVAQYNEPLSGQLNDVNTCPDELLLWFHHLPWNFTTKSGHTLWDEICYHYDKGVHEVRTFQRLWDKVAPYVDSARFIKVQQKLREQAVNSQTWKDGCLLYFQQFSKMPIPFDIERPVNNLDDLIRYDSQRKSVSQSPK